MSRMILGIFNDENSASRAIDELKSLGVPAKDISIVMRDGENMEHVESTGANVVGGAASGATTGGVLGGLAGLLIGLGAIAVPGIGALLIGGPIATALGLTGVAATTVSGVVTGALAGGLVGALVGWGVPEEEAKMYEERVRGGAVLLAVPITLDDEDHVREILDTNGADQVRELNVPTESRVDQPIVDEGSYSPAYFEEIRRKKELESDEDEDI